MNRLFNLQLVEQTTTFYFNYFIRSNASRVQVFTYISLRVKFIYAENAYQQIHKTQTIYRVQ